MFKTRWTLWEQFWAFLEFWKLFDFSKTFRRLDPPWNTGQKKFRKNYPKTCSKHVGTLFGTILGIFGKFENCSTFWKHFEDSTLHGKLGKKKFYPKTCSKHVWTLLGTILGIYGILKIFWIKSISKTRPSMEHWLKKFSKNLPQNTFKTIFDTFGNDFGHFWSFGNFFRRLDPPWNTGQKNFSKELPQNMFKTRLDKLGTVLGVFWKNFSETFRRLDPPWNTGQKKFLEKITPKHVQNTFGQFGNNFGRFWNFENFLNLYKDIS